MKKITFIISFLILVLTACEKKENKVSENLANVQSIIRETKAPDTSDKELDELGRDFSLRETKEVDFTALSKFGLPIIVDYGADSCIPCKRMAPVLEKANKEYKGKAFIKFVNVWDYPDATKNVPVSLIPTQVIFDKNGSPFVPSEELSKKIEFTMYTDDNNNHIFTVHQGAVDYEEMELLLKELGV